MTEKLRGFQIAEHVGLPRLMSLLEEHLLVPTLLEGSDQQVPMPLPVAMAAEKNRLMTSLTTLQRSVILDAEIALNGEKSRLVIEVQEEKVDGKARYSNEETRKAALTQKMATDQAYLDAFNALRRAQGQEAELRLKITEIEDKIGQEANLIWGLRSLIEGAAAAVNAVGVLDAPKFPAQVPLVFQGAPIEIQLKAPAAMPAIPVDVVTTIKKEAA